MKAIFGIEQKQLIDNLEKIRAVKLCAYIKSSRVCDCKFGEPGGMPRRMSESFSGCPEVRQALSMIKTMTEKEFNDICNRAKIDVS